MEYRLRLKAKANEYLPVTITGTLDWKIFT
jgi:hypothetical protein